MTHALPGPSVSGLVSQWTWQPVAVAVAVALSWWYLRAVRQVRARANTWPGGRTAVYFLGVALFVWTSCGWPQSYQRALFWVWTSQMLALMLIVPLVILAGQPLQLAYATSPRRLVDRFLRSGTGRFLANPLVGPALVPVLCAVLFFGPVPAWSIRSAPFGWGLQLLVVVLGALIVLPLVGPDERPSSLFVGLSLAIGSFELVLDAVPGIALRLHATLVTSYFHHRASHSWTPTPLHDQQIAGGVLWCVAELIDLPFLLLVFRRWLRADARDAAQIDAVLEAERASRRALRRAVAEPGSDADPATSESMTGESMTSELPTDEVMTDAPWWHTDPAMQRRYHNRNQ
ncbi:MAG: cytochrome c oxidase assembly protein [Actinomycetota bacterium]|nr:cytochrome c oxidase assembly protein [Actinomycetota bacterium]